MTKITTINIENIEKIKHILNLSGYCRLEDSIKRKLIAATYLREISKNLEVKNFVKEEEKTPERFKGNYIRYSSEEIYSPNEEENPRKVLHSLKKQKATMETKIADAIRGRKKGKTSFEMEMEAQKAEKKIEKLNKKILYYQDLIDNGKLLIELMAEYDEENDVISIYLDTIKSPSSEMENKYFNSAKEELNIALKKPLNISDNNLLANIFDVLFINKMSNIKGREAIDLKYIFKRAERFYPIFRKLPVQSKMQIMQEGVNLVKIKYKETPDIWNYSKYLVEAFLKNGIIDKIIAKMHYMDLEKVLKMENVYLENESEGFNIENVKFITFLHKGKGTQVQIRESFKPYFLWEKLARGNYE